MSSNAEDRIDMKSDAELYRLAEKIGDHCERAVTIADKIFLPYHSRKLRDDWIYKQLKELNQ
jgi:hypothetical protein